MRTILKSHMLFPGFVYTQGLKPLWKAVLERRGFGFGEQIYWFRVDEKNIRRFKSIRFRVDGASVYETAFQCFMKQILSNPAVRRPA